MNPVNWFEIPVTDMNRAKLFYSSVLNVELSDMPMEGMEMASFPWDQGGPNATGSLVKMDGFTPHDNGINIYFQCDDVANELGRVEKNGGKVIMEKTSIGEYGFIAMFIDTEGNRLGFHSMQ